MNRIKRLREEFKMSQSELGKKLNKTQQQISLYENGTNELDLDGYIILSKLFNCSVEYIAGKSDVRNAINMPLTEEELKFAMQVKELEPAQKDFLESVMKTLKEQKNKDK